jgi:hypothetical protein
MRLTFDEDEDFNNQSLLWEANQERCIRGKKGQAALRELEAALLALPQKRLITDELENAQGDVCAIGALARFKGKENPMIGDSFGDPEDSLTIGVDEIERATIALAQELGVPRLAALAVVRENDEDDYYPVTVTPERRYERMLKWVQDALSGKYGWVTKPST